MSNTNRSTRRIQCSCFVVLAFALAYSGMREAQGQDETAPVRHSQAHARVASLRSRFHMEREKAIESLSAKGASAAASLEAAAASDYPQERACALRALCRAAPERAAKLLVEAFLHDCISVRLAAARALNVLGVEGARVLLARIGEFDDSKRKILRSMIARACEGHVTKVLTEIEGSPAGQGQFPGQYRQLTRLGSIVEPALSRIVSDPSHFLAEAAAAALGELGDKAAIPALRKAYVLGGRRLKEVTAAVLHILGEDGPYGEVETRYREACQKGENRYAELALFYDRAREHEKGEKALREGIERFGASALTHINLACMLSQQNKVEEAFTEFVKGVEKGYTDMEWVKIDAELINLRASKQFQSYVRKKFPEAFKELEKGQESGEDK